ncbi:MAG: TSUP family transporter [Acidimicrobiia bacterium]|nr:TSUP family transporter [Acidimicrobiia bacterium]
MGPSVEMAVQSPPMSILEICVVGIIVFGAALIQGGIGFGYAVMVIPLLRLIDPSLTPIPQIFLALTLAVAAAWRERSSLVTTNMGWLMAGRVPGSMIGAWILTVVAVSTLDIIIALVVLAGITIVAWREPWEARPTICLVTGVASGIMGTTSAMSGPPIALLYHGSDRGEARASLGAIFAVGG